jgi:hypothetical protein
MRFQGPRDVEVDMPRGEAPLSEREWERQHRQREWRNAISSVLAVVLFVWAVFGILVEGVAQVVGFFR